MEWVLLVIGFVYLTISPFTKVEESFNLQAIHDILYHSNNISKYDHLEFPGVVPRTFIGPLIVAVLSSPFIYISNIIGMNKFFGQYIVRAVLGGMVIFAFHKFRRSIQKEYGVVTATWLILVTASQFHFNYYMSRPLPNIFALVLVLMAYHYWLELRHKELIITTAASITIFRFELALLLGLIILIELSTRRLSFFRLLEIGIPAGIFCISLSFFVDSYFWQRLLWPEGEVIWFNVIMNKSSEYGTSPWLWYFYSAIPRAMCMTLFLIPYAVIRDSRSHVLLFPAVGFVFLYSFLPHKELRFIIYTFPLFNTIAARTCAIIWTFRLKSLRNAFLVILVGMLLMMNLLSSCILLYISAHNYPGGHALARLHQIEDPNRTLSVHIDNLSAQTGVSRFGELNPNWRYDKTENLDLPTKSLTYTHLLMEVPEKETDIFHLMVLDRIYSFSHINVDYTRIPPILVEVKPLINVIRLQEQFTKVIIETKKYAAAR